MHWKSKTPHPDIKFSSIPPKNIPLLDQCLILSTPTWHVTSCLIERALMLPGKTASRPVRAIPEYNRTPHNRCCSPVSIQTPCIWGCAVIFLTSSEEHLLNSVRSLEHSQRIWKSGHRNINTIYRGSPVNYCNSPECRPYNGRHDALAIGGVCCRIIVPGRVKTQLKNIRKAPKNITHEQKFRILLSFPVIFCTLAFGWRLWPDHFGCPLILRLLFHAAAHYLASMSRFGHTMQSNLAVYTLYGNRHDVTIHSLRWFWLNVQALYIKPAEVGNCCRIIGLREPACMNGPHQVDGFTI